MSERHDRPTQDAASAEEHSHVAVVVRLRPPDRTDEDINELFTAGSTNVTIRDPLSRGRNEQTYVFNRVFLPEHGQQVVFECVAQPLVDRLMEGFNSCCFAYGQTGSGKTHSVFGEGNAEDRGMLARSIEYLFEKIEKRAGYKEVGMAVSFTEIYLDQVRDLGRFYSDRQAQRTGGSSSALAAQVQTGQRPSSASARRGSRGDASSVSDVYLTQDLQIHETPQGLVYVEDLALIPVGNIREVLDVANLGTKMRATYETRLNARSSRSHTIFTVSIVQKSRQSAKSDHVGSMVNFVDLAGSERLARSQSEGKRFQEAVVINSSLSALGKVVLALACDPKAARHVPYRDSKLTRILQNSLGGNSYTTLLATIDPSVDNYEESLNSLCFADRCKNVQNRPVLNYIDQSQETQERMVHKLVNEVATLKHQLEVATAARNMAVKKKSVNEHQQQHQLQQQQQKGGGDQPPQASQSVTTHEAGAPVGDTGAVVRAGEGEDGSRGSESPRDVDGDSSGLGVIQQQARDRLKAERLQTLEAEQRADRATAKLEQTRQEHLARDEQRRREAAAIRSRNRELEVDILKCHSSVKHLAGGMAAERDDELRRLEGNTRELVRNKAEIWKQLPAELLRETSEDTVDPTAKRRNEERAIEAMDRRIQVSRGVQAGHEQDCVMLERQQRQWLREKDAECQADAAKFDKYRADQESRLEQLHSELVATHDLACDLLKIVDTMELGTPAQLRSQIRPPSLQLPGLRSRLRAEGSLLETMLDQFFCACGELRRCAANHCQVLRQCAMSEPVTLRGLAAAEAGARCGIAGNSSGCLSGEPDGADTGGGSGGGSGGGVLAFDDCEAWSAAEFARDYCDVREGSAAGEFYDGRAPLQRLSNARLRAVCMALRSRARMTASELEGERVRLHDEVAKDLTAHGRVERISVLQKEIKAYQLRLSCEETRVRQLELALASSSRAASRPSSAGPRLASRPGSRPASAGPGRRW